MKVQIFGRPEFYIPFTVEQVGIFCLQSSTHYDATCGAASMPGGFLYGWKIRADFGTENLSRFEPCRLTYSELDLLGKITENFGCLSPEQKTEMLCLRAKIYDLFKRSNDLTKMWVEEREF